MNNISEGQSKLQSQTIGNGVVGILALLLIGVFAGIMSGKASARNYPTDVLRVCSDTTYVQMGICNSQLPYIWNGVVFLQAGTQSAMLTASDGSDSLVVMTLTTTDPTYLSVYGNACQGDYYTEYGFNLPPDSLNGGASLTFTRTIPNAAGCDSIITLHLTVNPTPTIFSSGDTILNQGESVLLSSTGADYYVWSPASNLSTTTASQTVCTPSQSMYVIVTGYDSGVNLIGNGDFEQGSAGFTSSYTQNTNLWGEGTYYVGSNASTYHSNFQGSTDHTTGHSNYMIVNGATSPGTVVWSQTIPVSPNSDYAFTTWVTTVANSPWAQLQFSINGQQIGSAFSAPATYGATNTWLHFYVVWNSGNNTQATISIVNQNTDAGGNDFGLDDISFFKLSNCGATDTIQVLVRHFEDTTICSYDLPFTWYGVNFTSSDSLEHIFINPNGVDDAVVMDVEIVESVNPDLGEDIYLCFGDMVELSLDSVPADVDILWNTGDTTASILALAEGTYYVSVIGTSTNGAFRCYGRDTVQVFSVEQPLIDFDAEPRQGCVPLSVHIDNHEVCDSCIYEWYLYDANGQLAYASILPDPDFEIPLPGVFTLRYIVTSPYGCTDSVILPAYIQANFQPIAEFAADPEMSLMSENGGVVHFINYSDSLMASGATITWDFDDGNTDGSFSPTHTYTQWGDYDVTLSIETAAGCNSEITHTVVVEQDLVFPNVITPNGDGLNDVFAIQNLNTHINPEDPDEYRHNDLFIYDRWGKKVYEAHNYDTFSRDGVITPGTQAFDGSHLPDGVYYFSFYYKGKVKTVQYNGTLTIIR